MNPYTPCTWHVADRFGNRIGSTESVLQYSRGSTFNLRIWGLPGDPVAFASVLFNILWFLCFPLGQGTCWETEQTPPVGTNVSWAVAAGEYGGNHSSGLYRLLLPQFSCLLTVKSQAIAHCYRVSPRNFAKFCLPTSPPLPPDIRGFWGQIIYGALPIHSILSYSAFV